MEKAVTGYPKSVNYDAIKKDVLFASVGKSNRSSTVGSETYLYWDCSDGSIQVVCSAGVYRAAGIINGSIKRLLKLGKTQINRVPDNREYSTHCRRHTN
jgi:hypothetical protein